jgi:PAS domain S-box-containing protein
MTIQYREDETTRASLELLFSISRELAAALDLRTVLQRIVRLSMENVGAVTGSIIVLDDTGQPSDSVIIVGTQVYEHTTQQLKVTFDRGLAGWVARQAQAVLVPDTSQDERWLRRPDDAIDRTGPKSAVSAPLMVRDRLTGVITLVHPKPGFFSRDHLALIQAIADQAGIAVLNARLFGESQRQARVMKAVAESAAVITASLDLQDVLQRILEQISQALRVEVVSLALIDPEDQTLRFHASTAGKDHSIVGLQIKLGQGIAGWVAQEAVPIILPDARLDPRYSPEIDRLIGFETRAVACAPITSQNQVIGVLEAQNPLGGTFDVDALLVLNGIGSLAGTAIRHAQLFERLQAAHERYLELFEDSIDPILITDRQGRIVEANRQAELTTNYAVSTLLGMSIGEMHALDLKKVGPGFERLSSQEPISYESILYTQNGRQLPIQVHARSVLIEGITHLQWILRDISERKNLDSLREDLISMIYHDLRSPLANVVSSLDVFAAMLPENSDPAFRSLLNIALRSTERIQRLTNSLLDINRLEAGQPIGNLFATSPLLVASDAVEAVLPVVGNKGLKLTISVPDDLPPILVDGDMIRRVLSNLLENAVKFTPPGGFISVGAAPDGTLIQMWVQDSGSGIPPADRDRIFDKFTRLKAKDTPKGFGLGLAYCRLAVEGHGGRIWVEGQPGEGARFCFTLPQANSRDPASIKTE